MNKANLKSYAPKARLDFIAAVTARANLLGISNNSISAAELKGDVLLIDGRDWPAKISRQRKNLVTKIKSHGFDQTIDEVAYTWFNRFAAIRYMELHDYLDHGRRVLSNREGGLPEILTHASELDLAGLNKTKATELQLAGNQDNELYRMLLVAQCNELSRVMPFLFEKIEDESELLLPDNLLRTDSIIAKLVEEIPEEDWKEVEIVGWLYQFYISDKKDQVIGKVVKSEDIPAATQLFTPNWIVQYLVQNSVGRLWLMANPQSTLAKEWPYYITPAEQTPEVQAQLDALIQTRVREDGDTLNPESITVLDPACGSGHILVVAYDVLKAIYLERGYQPRAIPRLILEKNLLGLDIDDRAAQMAGFALLMKARADDRRLLTFTGDAVNLQPPKLNVLSLQESKGLSVDELSTHLAPFKVQRATITTLVDTFEHAKTFGSLIQIPYSLKTHLAVLPQVLALVKQSGDMYASAAADDLLQLVQQAQMLAMKFDAVVANPPYMGGKGMNPALKDYAKVTFPDSKSDLFAMFIERSLDFSERGGLVAMITMQSWMFLSSYSDLRKKLFASSDLVQMFHTGPGLFPDLGAFNVLTTSFIVRNSFAGEKCISQFIKANGNPDVEEKVAALQCRDTHVNLAVSDLKSVPDFPLIYWLSPAALFNFQRLQKLSDACPPKQGMATGDNARFVRNWHEVTISKIGFDAANKEEIFDAAKLYVPYNKGGNYRKWYGNNEHILRFDRTAFEVLSKMGNCLPSRHLYFREGIVYSLFGFENFGVRYKSQGFVFDVSGASIFPEKDIYIVLAFLCSNVAFHYLRALAPTVNFQVGDLARLPLPSLEANEKDEVFHLSRACVDLCKTDWDSVEISWDFQKSPLISFPEKSFSEACTTYLQVCDLQRKALRNKEQAINKVMAASYRVQGEVEVEVNDRDLSIKKKYLTPLVEELISYAIGCMMGRYSLDEPGLIYAHAGNVGFEPGRYATFPADADGIVPITDELWFADDAPSRIREFLRAVWGPDKLEENMTWLAKSLGTKGNETPDETIRRYIADKFFKDHLQTYKKRPIYWLFSSGKQGAFQALVYLHRYNEGTLARMRSEYVVPLISKVTSRIEIFKRDQDSASSTAARTKIQKSVDALKKKQLELITFEEKLRHYADLRIKLDLDDGVKVNYAKFGDLVAESKAITGGSDD